MDGGGLQELFQDKHCRATLRNDLIMPFQGQECVPPLNRRQANYLHISARKVYLLESYVITCLMDVFVLDMATS